MIIIVSQSLKLLHLFRAGLIIDKYCSRPNFGGCASVLQWLPVYILQNLQFWLLATTTTTGVQQANGLPQMAHL